MGQDGLGALQYRVFQLSFLVADRLADVARRFLRLPSLLEIANRLRLQLCLLC